MSGCPSLERLQQFLAEQLGDTDREAVARHIDRCPRCLQTLERLSDAGAPDGLPRAPAAPDEAFLAQLAARPPWGAVLTTGPDSANRLPVHLREPRDETPVPVRDLTTVGAALDADILFPSGRYRIAGEIARGGMGAVLKGRDTELGRDLAVKVLLEPHKDNPELVQRFLEEAQIGGQLQHPGVVPVYEVGRLDDRRPYFTMKLVNGRTLAALLAARTDPADDRPKYLGIFEQVCQTLAYAHARGVIHRDLKPANIMVGSFGEVQVMDWGLAKVLAAAGESSPAQEPVAAARAPHGCGGDTPVGPGSRTHLGSILGTPAYMAPEQARGEPARVDERADVFGLGAILCEVLTGQPPYVGADGTEVYRKAAGGDQAETLERVDGSGADAELKNLVKRCLAPDPEGRPRDAGVVAAEVTAYLHSVAARLREAQLAGARAMARAEEERKRRRLTMVLAASVLVTVLLGSGVGLWRLQERAARATQTLERQAKVQEALEQAERLRQEARSAPAGDVSKLIEARALARRAEALTESGPVEPELVERVRGLLAEVEEEEQFHRLAARVEEIRLLQADVVMRENRFATELAPPEYDAAFRKCGLEAARTAPGEAAERIGRQPEVVRTALIGALDDWRRLAPAEVRVWLDQVVPQVDTDPWRARLRQAAGKESLEKLADEADVLRQPPQSLVLLGSSLHKHGATDRALALLRRAQERYPADFWINDRLAYFSARKKGQAADGVRFYTAAVALRPSSPAVYLNLGAALGRAEDVDGAIRAARKALELEPDYAEAHRNLGLMLERKGDRAGALAAFRKAIALKPGLVVDIRDRLTHLLLEKGDVDEALGVARTWVELTPHDAVAHNALAGVLVEKGDLAGGRASARKAIELKPDYAPPRVNLGTAQMRQGDLNGARGSFRKAIELQPDLPEAHFNLGDIVMRQRDVDGALACYRKAVELKPDHLAAHTNLGCLLCDHKQDYNGAIAAFRRALELKPDSPQTCCNLGNALARKGDWGAAIAAYRQTIELRPADVAAQASAYVGLGWLLWAHQRDADGAIAACHKALALQPNNYLGYHNLGDALRGKGDLQGAVAAYRKAIELKRDNLDAYYNLGVVMCDDLRDYEGAVAAFRKAIELKPDMAIAHTALGHALKGKGLYTEAAAAYRRGLELGPNLPGEPEVSTGRIRNAEQLAAVADKLPAWRKGDYQPRDNDERLGLARLCQLKGLRLAAARLYTDAFAAEPKLADDLSAAHRYDAACAAVLAGAGRDEDAAQLDEPARARWRQQAVAWLRADFVLRSEQFASGKPAGRAAVQTALQHWQRDVDLAGIRDAEALAKLPADEQETCKKLWADVAALLAKVGR